MSSQQAARIHLEKLMDYFIYARIVALFLNLASALKTLFIRRRSKQPDSAEKQEFLKEFGDYYGYHHTGSLSVDRLRASEFSRLNGTVYLDHAGATLYSQSQLQQALADCSAQLYGNPHSQSESSIRTSDAIEDARKQVLAYFCASPSDYACIFTSGATAALKLVGEAFPWTCGSRFFYTKENHNSVLGIREYALLAGATTAALSYDEKCFSKGPEQKRGRSRSHGDADEVYNLLALPTECNFSGAKSDAELVNKLKDCNLVTDVSGRWLVLLDAAKSAGTSPPDLSRYTADFVVISFYKIFGYPTGLGALIVRRDSANILNQRYFGGGTVAVSIADLDYVKRRENVEQRFEDGTVSFLSIRALHFGFSAINRLGVTAIARHTWALTHYTASVLRSLKHANGAPVCCVYGNHGVWKTFVEEFKMQGPVVTFNLKRADGSWVGYREVEKVASLCQIHLRTGCFCNPGACAKYLGLSNDDLRSNFEAGHVCWDDRDVISGKPTGAVRISFGYMSAFEDCQVFLRFIRKYFVEDINPRQRRHESTLSTAVHLKSIVVYPIKSCAGFTVESWPVASSGLLYDREFVICDSQNTVLTQKKVPSMCLLTSSIDLESDKLLVRSPNVTRTLEIPLKEAQYEASEEVFLCGERAKAKAYGGPTISEWFSQALGTECSLIRKGLEGARACKWRTAEHTPLASRGENTASFVNEGQFLLLSEASLEDLNSRANAVSLDGVKHQLDALQFRPNLVVAGAAAYEEDKWQMLRIGSLQLPVIGGCNRCKMITIDQKTGKTNSSGEPLLTLASYRRSKGKILFGMLLGAPEMQDEQETHWLTVGSRVELS